MSDANSEMSKVPSAELIPLSALLSLPSGFYDGRWIDGDSMAALVKECVRMAAPQAQPADALDAETIKNAARYDWLRAAHDRDDGSVAIFIDDEQHGPGHLDSQVDAAMAAAQEGGNAATGKDGAA